MNGLLSSASPWQNNDSVGTSKKRIPSLAIPRNKTIKNTNANKVNKTNSLDLDENYDLDNSDQKEDFQNNTALSSSSSSVNTLEMVQEDNQNRMSRVQLLINSMNIENDGQSLGNFKPLDYSTSHPSSSTETSDKYIPIKPLYSMNEQPTINSNPYSSYRDIYSGETSYGNNTNSNSNSNFSNKKIEPQSEKIMEKLNRMLLILEEQQYEPTKHITEEFILYTFLGVFVIYIVDSFTRAGKYIR